MGPKGTTGGPVVCAAMSSVEGDLDGDVDMEQQGELECMEQQAESEWPPPPAPDTCVFCDEPLISRQKQEPALYGIVKKTITGWQDYIEVAVCGCCIGGEWRDINQKEKEYGNWSMAPWELVAVQKMNDDLDKTFFYSLRGRVWQMTGLKCCDSQTEVVSCWHKGNL